MPKLTLFFGDDFPDEQWRGLTHELELPGDRNEWTIGRHPASDLTINVRNISRHHGAIAYSYANDRWSYTDLASRAGSVINGKKLTPHDPHPLAVGDTLWLASNPIRIVEDEHDTIDGDDGPSTVVDVVPLDYRPQAPPPVPRSYADNLDRVLGWLLAPQTRLGAVVRLLVVAVVGVVVVLVFDQ